VSATPSGDDAVVRGADTRLLSRTAGTLLAGGCVLGATWTVLSAVATAERVILLAGSAVGLLLAGLVLLRGGELSVAAFHRLPVLAFALISVAVALTGGLNSPFAFFYLWGAAWALAFLPRRIAWRMLAFIVAGYGVAALAAGEGLSGSEWQAWMLRVGTIVAVGTFLAVFAETLRRRETARRQAEQRLAARAGRQGAIAMLGQHAIASDDLEETLDEAAELVEHTLDVSDVAVLDHLAAEERFAVRASRGAPNVADDLAVRALELGAPIVAEDVVVVPVLGRARAHGVLAVRAPHGRASAGDDVDFLAAVANLLAGAIDRRAAEETMRHRSLHDPLTELPNRTLFLDRLELGLARARRRERAVAVLFLDLDNFKWVNDSLGHGAGDQLLVALAPRLRAAVRESDTVARLGGDEFAVLCEDVEGVDEAAEVAERLLATLAEPLHFGRDHESLVRASIGIAVARRAKDGAEGLLRDADAALYRAKERGRSRWELFDETMRTRAVARLRTEAELRRALEQGELRLALEPVVALETGDVRGAEALVRWEHPEQGRLAAGAFVPIAELSGLIVPLGRWMLDAACQAASAWAGGPGAPWISVNLAAREITEPGLVETVEAALVRHDLDPARLRLEVTESSLFEDPELPLRTLDRLGRLGVGLVLDDFGTGYSSLSHLHRFSVDAIKVDRSFVARLGQPEGDATIVDAMVGLGRALDIEVIAEGVERPEQARALLELGLDLGQGYACGRERTPREFARLLAGAVTPVAPTARSRRDSAA
jgi:diguanylate cyclase (GGDEF)-like protein